MGISHVLKDKGGILALSVGSHCGVESPPPNLTVGDQGESWDTLMN